MWVYHNKFDSTKAWGVYNWCVKIPQCEYLEYGLEYIRFYVQKHIGPLIMCYNPDYESDKLLGAPAFVKLVHWAISQILKTPDPHPTIHHIGTLMHTFLFQHVQSVALWDLGQVQCGICEIGQLAYFINARMHLFHIPQCSIQNRNVHISVLSGTLWDMEQVHAGICESGLLCEICLQQ